MENLSRHAVACGVCFMLVFQAQLSHLLMSFCWEEWLTGAVKAGRSSLTLTFRTLAVNHRDGVIKCITLYVLIQRNQDETRSVTHFTLKSSHKRSSLLIPQEILVARQNVVTYAKRKQSNRNRQTSWGLAWTRLMSRGSGSPSFWAWCWSPLTAGSLPD